MRYIAIVILSVLLWSCGGTDEPQPDVEPVKRTILVYMVAHNSLGYGGYDDRDITEMRTAINRGDLNGCRWLVYHHPTSGAVSLTEITSTGVDTLVKYSSDMYSVDPRRLQQVIADVQRLAPANGYGIVFWSHSNAWAEPERQLPGIKKSFGDDRGYNMSIPDLAKVVEPLYPDFIYFDCCYMGSVEVAYELNNCTPWMVASSTEIPVDGMPYDENIACLCADVPDLEQAARNTYQFYQSQTNPLWRSVAISVIRVSVVKELALASAAIYSQYGTVAPVGYEPQRLQQEREQYLWDFGDYMRSLAPEESVLRNRFDEAFAQVVAAEMHTDRMWNLWSLDRVTGLSGYILSNPAGAAYKGYDKMKWYQDVVQPAL